METLFWVSLLLVVYVYLGYPVLLAAWAAAGTRRVATKHLSDPDGWPSVSVVIAAHNAGPRLRARIENLLQQDYPGSLEIVVASDGSTDDTVRSVTAFGESIRVISLPRGGKPGALNAGVAASSGEIIVFADARQRFSLDAIRVLVSNFADPAVGGATGELILDCETPTALPTATTIGDGVGLYWKYEKWLRRQESRIWSTLGATGAIYALRRSLWRPLPPATLLDDVLAPMRVVLSGRRIVFDDRARAFDRVSPTGTAESQRKVRTLAGNYQILTLEPRLLLPFLNPVWVQYASHKIGRLLVPWSLVSLLVASFALAGDGWFYTVALIVQICFYGLAALGGWLETKRADATRLTAEPAPQDLADGALLPSSRVTHVAAERRFRAG